MAHYHYRRLIEFLITAAYTSEVIGATSDEISIWAVPRCVRLRRCRRLKFKVGPEMGPRKSAEEIFVIAQTLLSKNWRAATDEDENYVYAIAL